MLLDPTILHQCAPMVAPTTMQAIIKTESKGFPWAIGINKGYKLRYQAKSAQQARAWVNYLEKNNYNFDVGLAQVNIKNIHKYGYNAVDALDPCINLKMASDILSKNYNAALAKSSTTSVALQKAISAYNTGNYNSGFKNGYVNKVYANAKALRQTDNVPPIISPETNNKQITATPKIKIPTQPSPSREYVEVDPRSSKSVLYVRPNNAKNTIY